MSGGARKARRWPGLDAKHQLASAPWAATSGTCSAAMIQDLQRRVRGATGAGCGRGCDSRGGLPSLSNVLETDRFRGVLLRRQPGRTRAETRRGCHARIGSFSPCRASVSATWAYDSWECVRRKTSASSSTSRGVALTGCMQEDGVDRFRARHPRPSARSLPGWLQGGSAYCAPSASQAILVSLQVAGTSWLRERKERHTSRCEQ